MELLINITLKSTFILLFVGILLLILKNASATLRHWVISLTMIGLLGLPILIGILPNLELEMPFLGQERPENEIERTLLIENHNDNFQENNDKTTYLPVEKTFIEQSKSLTHADDQVFIKPENTKNNSFALSITFVQFIVFLWILGTIIFLIKFSIGINKVRNITVNSFPFCLPKSLQKLSLKFTKRPIQFLINESIATPMTWGIFKPIVLLPKMAKNWTKKELETVLFHELIHIKRQDYLMQILSLLTICFYWFNPLVWLLKKRQLLEREKACDELVIRQGVEQQSYAEQLVNMARHLSKRPSFINEHALPMAKSSQIKQRIVAILKFEEQNFQFSTYKQWKWGLFYCCLFPILAAFTPVGKNIIQKKFNLEKLEKLNPFIITDGLKTVAAPLNFSLKKGKQNDVKETLAETESNVLKNIDNQELELISKLPPSFKNQLPSSFPKTINIDNNRVLKTGLFGKWKEGKSEFRIFTYGEVRAIPTPPYLEIISDDGLIFIEEYIEGVFNGKIHQLTLTKAPFDGRMKPDFGKEIDLSPNKLIRKGELLKIWSKNKGFLFFKKNMDKWIDKNVQKMAKLIANKSQSEVIKIVDESNEEWWKRIKGMEKWIAFNFIANQEIIAGVERKRLRMDLDLLRFPFKKINLPNGKLNTTIIGRQKLSRKKGGSLNTSPIGKKYSTLLKGSKKPINIKDFNFHLAENDFKNLAFDLYLYNVENGKIKHSILKQPISITIAEGKGWIRKDLSNYNIVSQGDVLIILKNLAFSGSKKGKKLYFSLDDKYEKYQPILQEGLDEETKYWENAFVMYLTGERNDDF